MNHESAPHINVGLFITSAHSLPGIVFQERFGPIGLVVYLGAIFSTLASLMWLLVVAVAYRILLPGLKPGMTYSGNWFLLRKWFMDRLFLSPMFRYASERTLQTSSTFPLYLRLLGAKIGKKAWTNVSNAASFSRNDSS